MANIVADTEVFDELYNKLVAFFQKIDHTADNFVVVLVKSMEIVEEWADSVKNKVKVHGLEKKELVEELMYRIQDKFEDAAEKVEVQVKYWMDKLIDVLVAAAKGNLHFNEELRAKCNGCIGRKQKGFNPKDITEIDEVTKTVHEEVKKSIVNKQFTAANFVVLVTLVMQIVEKFPTLSGSDKKVIAVQVIKRLIMEIPMPEGDKAAIELIVETTLSKTIDFIIAAASGEFDFGKLVTQMQALFPCFYNMKCCKKE